jgi:hypothetical protein
MLKIVGITDLEAISDIINVIIPMTVVCAGIFAVFLSCFIQDKEIEVRKLITE